MTALPMQDSTPKDADHARSEVDIAFDEWWQTLYVHPYGKSGTRETFNAGWRASRGEQPIKPEPPPMPRPAYPLKKRPA